MVAEESAVNQRPSISEGPRVQLHARVVVPVVVRHHEDLAAILDQLEQHFRVPHRVAVLLAVVRHRNRVMPVWAWDLDVLDHQPHVGLVFYPQAEPGAQLPGRTQNL